MGKTHYENNLHLFNSRSTSNSRRVSRAPPVQTGASDSGAGASFPACAAPAGERLSSSAQGSQGHRSGTREPPALSSLLDQSIPRCSVGCSGLVLQPTAVLPGQRQGEEATGLCSRGLVLRRGSGCSRALQHSLCSCQARWGQSSPTDVSAVAVFLHRHLAGEPGHPTDVRSALPAQAAVSLTPRRRGARSHLIRLWCLLSHRHCRMGRGQDPRQAFVAGAKPGCKGTLTFLARTDL